MKTIDEVIKAIEYCLNPVDELGNCREECPNIHCCDPTSIPVKMDALYYLKAYRDDKDDLTALRAFWKEQQENEPLTWDELKTMEGKPVWVEYCLRKTWVIIDCFYTDAFYKSIMNVALPHDYWNLEKEMMGKTWQAYRRERE